MPIPNYQSLMLPILQALADGSDTTLSTLRERVAASIGLTDEEIAELIPSGQTRFAARIQWARLGLNRAGLLQIVSRGVYRLTPVGKELLARNPERIDDKILYNEYVTFAIWKDGMRERGQQSGKLNQTVDATSETPEETLGRVAEEMRIMLEAEVLERLRNAKPSFLEKTVASLLETMGYGETRVTGKAGDDGIDAKVLQDKLGLLDKILVQAKRYASDNHVSPGDIREFVGALNLAGETRGVFVTTSRFTESAIRSAENSTNRIILIDGMELARLMVRHSIGVRTLSNYEIKGVDEDYFDLN